MNLKPLLFAAAVVTLVCACPPSRDPAPPKPRPAPDTELCGAVCKHIGPEGLNCEEGQPVYDSDKPGPKGVPNESCEEFCALQQNNGVVLNPKCLLLVKSCDEIEAARNKVCQ